ncbi:MAG: META domain-containing protein [Acidimicrobiales bacterium]|nr:META domain-containing protein [Acidimicrobiales bacterium]
MRSNPLLRMVLLAGALCLLVAACGDDADGPLPGGQPLPTDAPSDDAGDNADDSGDDGGDIDLFGDDEPSVDRSADLVGRWTIDNYSLPDGAGLTNVVGETPAFIEFNGDGSLAYHTGCNSGSGQWSTSGTYYVPSSALDDEPEGQSIAITDLRQTEIGCDGFLGEQDVDLPANFAAATRFRIADDGSISLLDEFLLVSTVPA